MIAFISGGARSGKSDYAERLARQWRDARGGDLWYLATARATDDEMAERIARHRRQRGEGWRTLEAPLALDAALDQVAPGETVLLDCLTLWASQWRYGGGGSDAEGRALLARVLSEAKRRGIALVVVSNDINEGLPAEDGETRAFVAFLQGLHRDLAAEAEQVVQLVAGLPWVWKGEGP
ncbi:bifunctional adenosylcobinamide kinase/adenosylcobinamide-phosphate guanylyltransferase [Halomonas sp. NCCP-2165]|nr:bifunctional adenosylcobinamide kinase/adenosylcobinamide-phosphate guanylyltransferase [Halomonas sp. NCCP-2165]GKW49942.1 adenosylcobinamide kinase/adenosylcobinamide phosphate guanyltransferase [Halomonas sp. NCCP-2165]